ncbi:hypothetical protein D047_4494A, partial [Vibrio parahaemolyticus VPTS-2010_2]
MVLIGAGGE